MVYLDHAATTVVFPEVIEIMTKHLSEVGNPSSLHTSGRAARKTVEIAREKISTALNCLPGEVVFTSGGTEANNLAIKGLYWLRNAQDQRRKKIVISSIEHHAVLDPAQWMEQMENAEVVFAPVDELGGIDLEALRNIIENNADGIALISIMFANNEVGTVQPIEEIVALAKKASIPVHTDAVQAVGAIEIDFKKLGVDALTLSGHKIGGPMGIGALILRREFKPVPVLHGGGQEREVRSGTIPTHLIAALGEAVKISTGRIAEHREHLIQLRDRMISGIESIIPDAVLNGDRTNRLPGNVHFTFIGCEGDALLMLLDAAQVECSTGSACTAGIPQPSHVLMNMGISEEVAVGALRFSLGRTSNLGDIELLERILPETVERARRAGKTRQRL
jgi:cysteine desulfurase